MAETLITPSPVGQSLVAGHWRRGRSYVNRRPEGSSDYLLIATRSGAGVAISEGREIRLDPGSFLLYSPQVPQQYSTAEAERRWELLWAHFRPPATWMPWLSWPTIGPGVGFMKIDDPGISRRVQTRLRAMVRRDRGGNDLSRALAINALEQALLMLAEARGEGKQKREDPRLIDSVDLIHRRYDQPLSVADLAAAAHLSLSRFAHLFREVYGVTPQQYLENQRMQRAAQLIERTGLAVGEVGRAVGYDDPYYFSRRFKIAWGLSPREFRRQRRGDGR